MIDEIKRVMLGHVPCNIKCVLITPLKSTFYKLKDTLNIEESFCNCFYENFYFKIEQLNKRVMVILSPQGISAKDIIELFNNTNIMFFGLAGSLNSKIKIGTMVEVECVLDENNNRINLATTGNYETVECGYSPCLLGNIAKKYCDFYRNNKCDIVDMETLYCAKTAIEHNNIFISLQLISDIPEIINFWELDENKRNEFKKARTESIHIIIEEIKYICEIN